MDSQEYADYLFNLKDKESKKKKRSSNSSIVILDDYACHYDRNTNSVVEYMNIGGIFTQVSIVK